MLFFFKINTESLKRQKAGKIRKGMKIHIEKNSTAYAESQIYGWINFVRVAGKDVSSLPGILRTNTFHVVSWAGCYCFIRDCTILHTQLSIAVFWKYNKNNI